MSGSSAGGAALARALTYNPVMVPAAVRHSLVLVALVVGSGCTPTSEVDPEASRGALGETTPGAPTSDTATPTSSTPDAPTPATTPGTPAPGTAAAHEPAAPDELVLDQRPDGARLVGHPEPRLPHADPERVVALRVLRGGDSIAEEVDASLDGARVLDARFVGDAILTIGADHVMRVHRGGDATPLDTGAYGPLSVVGTRVAYARGEAPSLELARADVATLEADVLTAHMAPVWSPALSPDGRAIVFVSGVDGSPRLYRVEGDGPPRALPDVGRFPTAPTPPRFEDDLYVFEDHLGTAWVDLEAGRIVRTGGGAR